MSDILERLQQKCPDDSETEFLLRDAAEEIEQLRAEVQRLQRALHFWLPHVPATGSYEILMRTGDDAMLLAGYDPTEPVELDAEARGWITLNAQPQSAEQQK